MQNLDDLARFAIPGRLGFRGGPGDLLFADLQHPGGSAQLCLQGAHLTTFRPASQQRPVVWLSERARFAAGKSIRGGAPVCWPWFGAHPTRPDWPAHGFARTVPWALIDAYADADATVLSLQLTSSDATRAQWPHDTPLTLRVAVSAALDMALTTQNAGNAAVTVSEALHTYFEVGDIARATVHGLDGTEYLDKTEGFARKRQSGPVHFAGETDRVYLHTTAECHIDDPVLGRRIRIAKQGSASTVVWTPWEHKAAAMGDFSESGWRQMLCVESANAADDAVVIAPGATHTLSVRYSAEAL